MKSKAQKQEELKKGSTLLNGSKVLVFADFTKVKTQDFRRLRKELGTLGAKVMVMKKRLLNILMKEKKLPVDSREFSSSVATVFSPVDVEKISAPVYAFFKELGKDIEKEKILGGVDVAASKFITADDVRLIGQLPPRDVLLGQLAGMIAAPIRAFLYVLSEKSKK